MIKPIHDWLTIDEYGVQMPWYTRPCLEVLNEMDFKNKEVFEYGVGYSTLWYKSRGAKCSGVDSSLKWIDLVGGLGIHHHMIEGLYIYNVLYRLPVGGYDVVVIDGNFRDNCTEYALKGLKPGGKLILDNWLQPEVEEFWPKTEELIKGLPIEVYKEPEHPHWKTAIVTKP